MPRDRRAFSSNKGGGVALALLAALVAQAAYGTTEGAAGPAGSVGDDAYLAARRAAVARIKTLDEAGGGYTEARTQLETRLLHDLEGTLRRVVGPVAVKGFWAPGHANLQTLSADVGAGALDAMSFQTRDQKTDLYVTTERVFLMWLKEHEVWFPDEPPLPQDAKDALHVASFYTQAISADAAISLYGSPPVAPPGDATLAIAQLDGASQDQPAPRPDQLTVSVMRRGKVLMIVTPLNTAFSPIPACDALRATYETQREALSGAAEKKRKAAAADTVDEASMDALTHLEAEAAAATLRCFATHAKDQPAFAAAGAQAQALVDLMSR